MFKNKENNDVNINKAYNAIHGKLKAFGKKALPFSWENRVRTEVFIVLCKAGETA